MSPSEAPATTSPYTLSRAGGPPPHFGIAASARRLVPLLAPVRQRVFVAIGATAVSSAVGLTGPVFISRAIDVYLRGHDFAGVLRTAGVLLLIYLCGLAASYTQTMQMGTVGRNVLFNLRNKLFTKLQTLPLDFFHQNRAGELISRINNDTDKLNQFFAQSLVQLAGNLSLMTGAVVAMLLMDARLAIAALAPAVAGFIFTSATGPWVRRASASSLRALAGLSAEVQESLSNFRVIVAFSRVDYFRRRFAEVNARNYAAAVRSGLRSNIFVPIFGLALNLAQIGALGFAVVLIGNGTLTVGVAIGFLLYVNSFYMPLRQLAVIWSSFQLAIASLDRVNEVLSLESNLIDLPPDPAVAPRDDAVIAFDHVRFGYGRGEDVLRDATFALQKGKTYALVGPTGGGKTTTASLMARLYDPQAGRVLLDGRDIRTVPAQTRAARIGFILQEPFLFNGTVRDNVVYGSDELRALTPEALADRLGARGLTPLLERFPQGLETQVASVGDGISLGQKQLVAFMRAVLRDPGILILDEATANIDTVTEQLLEQILGGLPASTTRVIIAHRLNTIENADEIFFIGGGEIRPAGSMQDALKMLSQGRRT